MGYFLGVDIGTTYTAAAVWRDGRCDVASLGNRAPTIPSVLFVRDDGSVLIGEAAVRRAASEPAGVAREFKRRIGDPTPLVVGGTPYSADALMAKLLRGVVDLVVQAEGGTPEGIAVSHPANWGPYKLDLLRQAARLADLDGVVTVSEPEAAAIHYASQARVDPGAVIAVYDLGGGTFDAAVLRKTATGWEVLGAPEGIERLGGIDFDAAVHHHVASSIAPALDELSPDDPAALAAAARLRQECVDAKEVLSSDSDVAIPVLLPTLQTDVRLTRAEYEQMVRPALADTITSLNRALRSAGVGPEDVTTVLLVGGSSRTPLVAELVSSALRRPVAVDAHPKYGVALGAAITAAVTGGRSSAGDDTSVTVPPTEKAGPPAVADGAPAVGPGPTTAATRGTRDPRHVRVGPPAAAAATVAAATAAAAPTGAAHAGPAHTASADGGRGGSPGGSRRPLYAALGAVAAIVLAGGAILAVLAGDDGEPGGASTDQTTGDGEPPGTTAAIAPNEQAPETTEPPPAGPFVRITDVVLDGGRYRVDYEVTGFTPQLETPEAALHIHFFPDTQTAAEAGTNGPAGSVWDLTAEPQSFLTKYAPGDELMAGATQMCSAVADVGHAVHTPETRTGDCYPLPS
jgi:molecular chaperone DnaK